MHVARYFPWLAGPVFLASLVLPRCLAETASPPLAKWDEGVMEANKGNRPLSVVCIGDSNTEIFGYAGALRMLLQSRYGDRGIGYCTFGKRMAELPGAPKMERKGEWTLLDSADDPRKPAPPKPWLCIDGLWVATEDLEAELRVDVGHHARLAIHHQVGPGLGSFVILPKGKKEPVTVTCTAEAPGYETVAFEAGQFALKPKSGKVVLFGVDVQRPTMKGGAVVHQMGNAWGMAHHSAAIEEGAYGRFFKGTRPALVTVLLGTNDMNNGWYPNEFRDEMRVLLTKLRKAAPESSLLVMSYPSCKFDRKKQAKAFDAAAREAAREAGAAFCSLHDLIGDNWRLWDHAGMTEWTLHFTPAGGTAIALHMLKALGFDINDPASAPAVSRTRGLLPNSVQPAKHLPEEGWPQRPDRKE